MIGLPRSAIVLAAGLGTRMRPITDTMPKALVPVGGKPLIDWGLDALAAAGVGHAVVNVHHFAARIEAHLAERTRPRVTISDETGALLESGGGIVRALPLLGPDAFFVLNADTFWLERGHSSLARLAQRWDDARMDMLLLLAHPHAATGHGKGTDFILAADGRLARSGGAPEGLIYAGAAILHPRALAGAPEEAHSLNHHFDTAIAAGRLHGLVLDGHWITVGTPQAISEAEAAIDAFAAPVDRTRDG